MAVSVCGVVHGLDTPAQASWEAYQQAGEEAYERGDYAIAQRMFLAAVREAKHFGPQDPRLDISLQQTGAPACNEQCP